MTSLLSAFQDETIQYYEIDPMNVMWHGHYFRLFEGARCQLMALITYTYTEMEKSGYVWPFVDFRIKYIQPLFLHQQVRVEATLEEYKNRLKINYFIRSLETNALLTKATSIQVAVQMGSNTLEFESPPVLINKVKEHLS